MLSRPLAVLTGVAVALSPALAAPASAAKGKPNSLRIQFTGTPTAATLPVTVKGPKRKKPAKRYVRTLKEPRTLKRLRPGTYRITAGPGVVIKPAKVRMTRKARKTVRVTFPALNPTPAPDSPPGPVSQISAVPQIHSVRLTWTNPADPDLAQVLVRRTVGTQAAPDPGAGVPVTPQGTSLTDHGLVPNRAYTYTVFTRDAAGNTGPAASLTARTRPAPISAGNYHTCATVNGPAFCWGLNNVGQLGISSAGGVRNTPTAVTLPPGRLVTEISAGPQHSCYLLDDASVRCSGENGAGQLGDGSLGTKSAMSSPALTDAMGISAGGGHTCAVRKDGSVWCWGTNNFGQLGVGYFGAPVNTALRVQNISDAVQVSAGTGHACALRVTGQVLCWGLNSEGQLTGDSTFSTVPIVALEGATSLDVAASTSCAVMQDGSVRCWGRNANGQVGDGTTGIVRRAPTAVLGVNTATAVAVGLNHTCVLLTDGTAGCWGKNASGELGRPGAPAGDYPQSLPVANLTDAITLQAGGEHNCVVQPSGLVLCWGRNLERQLATANDSPSALPIPTAGGFDVYP